MFRNLSKHDNRKLKQVRVSCAASQLYINLFLTLVDRGVEPLFLRLMMYVYRNQRCNVKWSDQFSSEFTVSNGVRQGAVSSAILFAVYIDEILSILRLDVISMAYSMAHWSLLMISYSCLLAARASKQW